MRKFIISSMAVLLALGMISGAFAYMVDTETSIGNTFTACADNPVYLQLTDYDETSNDDPDDSVYETWMMECMVPGVSQTLEWSVSLWNGSSSVADHVEISFEFELDERCLGVGPE